MAAAGKHPTKRGNRRTPRPTDWISAQHMREVFGVSASVFHRAYRPAFPDEAMRREGMRLLYNAPICIRAWQEAERLKEVKSTDIPDDESDAGSSPALERGRLARAKLAELQLQRERGRVLPIADVLVIFAGWAAAIRQASELLGQRGDDEAVRVLNAALERCERECRAKFQEGASDG